MVYVHFNDENWTRYNKSALPVKCWQKNCYWPAVDVFEQAVVSALVPVVVGVAGIVRL